MNLHGQIKTFDMNMPEICLSWASQTLEQNSAALTFSTTLGELNTTSVECRFGKNSMMLWSYSESENVHEFEYPQQAYTYYDSYNFWDENFIQGS